MNANRTLKLTTLALCGVINILGGTVALLLRLPVYLDSIGTPPCSDRLQASSRDSFPD
jgi:energy-coupling factor transport system substrate-specific component